LSSTSNALLHKNVSLLILFLGIILPYSYYIFLNLKHCFSQKNIIKMGKKRNDCFPCWGISKEEERAVICGFGRMTKNIFVDIFFKSFNNGWIFVKFNVSKNRKQRRPIYAIKRRLKQKHMIKKNVLLFNCCWKKDKTHIMLSNRNRMFGRRIRRYWLKMVKFHYFCPTSIIFSKVFSNNVYFFNQSALASYDPN
jgi:hypothetical protein